MTGTLDWNAKTTAEFRADEGRVGGTSARHAWSGPASAGRRPLRHAAWASLMRRLS